MYSFYKIIIITLTYAFFIPLNGSQSVTHHLHRDYTLGESRVLSPQERQENFTTDVLLSLGEDNKLFVCYAEYTIIKQLYRIVDGGGFRPSLSLPFYV